MMRKGALSFDEKVTAAYLHYAQGVDQHVIATAMGVNQGRVNEACVTIKRALNHERVDVYSVMEGEGT
jgi:DNA-binding transcriptional regulator LsrR (DeoR family)